jgi:hypothetical protein
MMIEQDRLSKDVRGAGEIDERREQMIDRLAGWIVAQGLRSPALLFIETARPLALIGGQALLLMQPFLGAIGPLLGLPEGEHTLSEYAALLEDSASIDRLLERLEAPEAAERGDHESNVA